MHFFVYKLSKTYYLKEELGYLKKREAMGGLKLSVDNRRDITPTLLKEAIEVYNLFLRDFNYWLLEQGKESLIPIGPVGSAIHAERDLEEKRDVTYGDIDYLVSTSPSCRSLTCNYNEKRKEEASLAKEYAQFLELYLKEIKPSAVDVDLTLGGNPLIIVLKLPSGGFVQVDTIITHSDYVSWMKGRYSTERGIKGYITGNLYKSLGDCLTLTIGTEGVIARVKDGKLVSSRVRSGVEYHCITTSFRSFLKDISDFLVCKDEYDVDELLNQHPGLDPNDVNIDALCKGIVGLTKTLEKEINVDSKKILLEIYNSFMKNVESNVDRKTLRNISSEKEKKLRDLNLQQSERIRKIFGV